MTIKSVFVGPMLDVRVEERAPSEALTRYAIGLAASQGAHLSIAVGCCKLMAPSAGLLREARALIMRANEERFGHAQTYGADLLTQARVGGATAELELLNDTYVEVSDGLVRRARLADLAVMQPSDETFSLTQGAAEEVLFASGRPVIFVPPAWQGPFALESVVVAWDGSAKAARAIGDAMPLLAQAKQVEVIAISGDPDATKRVDGAEIAPHLSRHCRNVRVTGLPAGDDVAETLSNHARLVRADLLVMGAFAHSRLRQLVLGGVTRRMIVDPPVPTLMSY